MSLLSASFLTQTIDDHITWMTLWSRLALSGGEDRALQNDALCAPESFIKWQQEAVKDLQNQPALDRLVLLYEQLHRAAKLVMLKSVDGAQILPSDYDSVSAKYQEFLFGLRRLERALAAAESGLDKLTGLKSRVGMRDDLMREIGRFLRNGKPFCLALADIDHFKRVNDTYGHENGDRVLSAVANHLSRNLRSFDDVWRWGGEEFLLCLKEADLAMGLLALERVRVALEYAPIKLSDGHTIKATASFGIVVATKEAGVDELLAQADKALYRAKNAGRNRIESA
jgi:diguanylate cyclase (GGDEF)-like protein